MRTTLTRRALLRRGILAAGGIAAAAWIPSAVRHRRRSREDVGDSPFGPLSPVADRTTGLPLLLLPAGFEYVSFGWQGDPMADGITTPADHDGMAVVRAEGRKVWLVRNHECRWYGKSFGPPAMTYDPRGTGGTTTLVFDVERGVWLEARASLAGTVGNCSGGATPWGTFLSCEESFDDRGEPHGWVFEVDPLAGARPEPLRAMGRFNHEAVVVHPATGVVYQTEDRPYAGFYRFLPNEQGRLARGGQLQMLGVDGDPKANFTRPTPVGSEFAVRWMTITDPEAPDDDRSRATPFQQGRRAGGAVFRRLEGCWWDGRAVWFTSTDGGAASTGQLWRYHPDRERLVLAFESLDARLLDLCDQGTWSPRGGHLLCEDGDVNGQRLQGISADQRLFTFAENAAVLHGEMNGIAGDYTGMEFSGPIFHGRWLFVNLRHPGITVAITGPWRAGWI